MQEFYYTMMIVVNVTKLIYDIIKDTINKKN